MDEVLIHHGVLGMKWGIRRYQNTDGSLTDAGKKRYLKKSKKIDRQIDRLERKTERLNKRYSKSNFRSDYQDMLVSKYQKEGFTKKEAELMAYKEDRVDSFLLMAFPKASSYARVRTKVHNLLKDNKVGKVVVDVATFPLPLYDKVTRLVKQADAKIVSDYRKENPNAELSYTEILREEKKKKFQGG